MATKKKLKKLIAARAAEVPQVDINVGEWQNVFGAELLMQGETEIDGKPIDPKKLYRQKMPVVMAVNHGRRMAKVFKKHGNEGLLAYYDAVDKHNDVTSPPREVARNQMENHNRKLLQEHAES
jgi:hypothetical protein